VIWLGFLERQCDLGWSPDFQNLPSLNHDFEVCENLSRLALDRDTDAVCVEDIVDFGRLCGNLKFGTLLHWPGNISSSMINSHVLERMLVY